MEILGAVTIIVGMVLSTAVECAARGKIGINPIVGIRVGYVTHSPAAWQAGHRAARWPTHAGTAAYITVGVLLMTLPMSETTAGVLGIGAAAVLLGMIGFGAFRANRAAETAVVRTVSAAQGS